MSRPWSLVALLSGLTLPYLPLCTPLVAQPAGLVVHRVAGEALAARAPDAIGNVSGFTIEELARLNGPSTPHNIGVVKRLDRPIVAEGTSGRSTWVGEVRAEGAAQLRIHLEQMTASDGAFVRVVTPDGGGSEIAISSETSDLWLPAVQGPVAFVEVEPATTRFRIGEVASIRDTVWTTATIPWIDAECVGPNEFPAIERVRHAVAQLTVIHGGNVARCTGTLVADRAGSGTPYLLTANHCILDDETAASVQAVFDGYTATCDGPAPDWQQLPSAVGARLLASAGVSDAALLRALRSACRTNFPRRRYTSRGSRTGNPRVSSLASPGRKRRAPPGFHGITHRRRGTHLHPFRILCRLEGNSRSVRTGKFRQRGADGGRLHRRPDLGRV